MTLRLSDQQAAELEALARVENVPISETVRAAITSYIAQKRQDATFQERLQASMERYRKVLDRLAQT